MSVRVLAALCLAVLPTYCGFVLAEEEKRRVRDLFGILELLSHVRYEISAFLTRRSDLFVRFECRALEKSGFLPALKAAADLGCDNPLYSTLTEQEQLLVLSREDRRLLTDYALHLGEFDAAEEVARAERCAHFLQESFEKQKEEQTKRVRLYRTFGVVLSLAILLFVW